MKGKEFTFSDSMEWAGNGGAGNRATPALWIMKGADAPVKFTGEPIPGVLRVLTREYIKNGKWSHDVFRVSIHPEAEAATVCGTVVTSHTAAAKVGSPLMREEVPVGKNIRGCAHWAEVPEALRPFVRAAMPKNAARLDAADEPW